MQEATRGAAWARAPSPPPPAPPTNAWVREAGVQKGFSAESPWCWVRKRTENPAGELLKDP